MIEEWLFTFSSSSQRAEAFPAHHAARHPCWRKHWAAWLWKTAPCHHLDVVSMHTGQNFTQPKSNRSTNKLARKGAAAQAASPWGNNAARNTLMEGRKSFLPRQQECLLSDFAQWEVSARYWQEVSDFKAKSCPFLILWIGALGEDAFAHPADGCLSQWLAHTPLLYPGRMDDWRMGSWRGF